MAIITQRTYDQRNRIKTITNQTTGAQTQYFYDSQRKSVLHHSP